MTIAFTVCTANYLPLAKALADSVIRHNPDYKFIIALADHFKDYDSSFFVPHTITPIVEMGLDDLGELNDKYNIFELSCALKPFVALHLLETYKNCKALFYFDSDIYVYNRLTLAETLLNEHCLVITPHVSEPLSPAYAITTELNVLKTGVYNTGFFGVSNTEDGVAFLQWWKVRLKDYCFDDSSKGLFVDQLWLNLAPVYFKKTAVLYDPGYNLAYWNFGERQLSVKKADYRVNEKYPLVFFHFSGFDVVAPQQISKHQHYYSFEMVPEYLPLFEEYATTVLRNNKDDLFALPATMGKPAPPPPPPPSPPPVREKNFFKRKWQKVFKNNS